MKIKIFDTRMISPMKNNIFDLENNETTIYQTIFNQWKRIRKEVYI
jgi:hypothetical protein